MSYTKGERKEGKGHKEKKNRKKVLKNKKKKILFDPSIKKDFLYYIFENDYLSE